MRRFHNLVLPVLCWVCAWGTAYGDALDPGRLPRSAHVAVFKAQQAMDQQDYAKAETILREYTEKHPGRPEPLVFYVLGNALYMAGKVQEAYEAYRKGYALAPEASSLCRNLAAASYELGKYRESGAYFEQAYARTDPPERELLFQAGVSFFQAEAYEDTKRVLETLLRMAVEPEKPWVRLFVQACVELEQWSEAESFLRKFLETSPAEAEYWKLLGRVQLRQENYIGAAGSFEIAYRIEPPSLQERVELATICFYIDAPLRAVRHLESAYGDRPSPEQCDDLARGWARAGRLDRALFYLDRSIQQEPTASRHLEKGKLLYDHGLWQQALEAFRACIRYEPNHGTAHLLEGYCAWELGDLALAREAFSKAAEQKPVRRHAVEALAALDAFTNET